ncbi:hypothetical protein DUNSADRAFT_4677 [Dunaliella salina]|uniref:Encoded protein n=1 Tax=Dunaliella salina TaxID=3046 RepID=A0ABQ7GRI5_DUNSA|nr:hypothetical protein DUNSADRAFT_4677 [Dunaliella salina]|eukprot:KAF5837222.1 hypothetical protein DUNSADRAFT_4677 [Dunaliella salina]
MLRQCKVAHGSSGNTSNPFSPHLSSWTPGGAPSAHALRSVLSSSRPALCVPSAGRVQLTVQAREVCDTIPTSPTPTYLSSQDENKDVGSSSDGGKQQTGSREDEQEAVRRSLRDALLQRGAKPSSSSDGGKEGSSKEGKPFQFQTPRKGGGPPGMGGGGSPFRPSPAKILAGHALGRLSKRSGHAWEASRLPPASLQKRPSLIMSSEPRFAPHTRCLLSSPPFLHEQAAAEPSMPGNASPCKPSCKSRDLPTSSQS